MRRGPSEAEADSRGRRAEYGDPMLREAVADLEALEVWEARRVPGQDHLITTS